MRLGSVSPPISSDWNNADLEVFDVEAFILLEAIWVALGQSLRFIYVVAIFLWRRTVYVRLRGCSAKRVPTMDASPDAAMISDAGNRKLARKNRQHAHQPANDFVLTGFQVSQKCWHRRENFVVR